MRINGHLRRAFCVISIDKCVWNECQAAEEGHDKILLIVTNNKMLLIVTINALSYGLPITMI